MPELMRECTLEDALMMSTPHVACNNPMVGMTVAVAVAIEEASK